MRNSLPPNLMLPQLASCSPSPDETVIYRDPSLTSLKSPYHPGPPCCAPRSPFSAAAARLAKKKPPPPPKSLGSSSSAKGAAKKAPASRPAPGGDARAAWRSPAARARDAFVNPIVQRFLGRDAPALLYRAPSPAAYVVGCYLLGGACFAYAAKYFRDVIYRRPAGLKQWVVNMFWVILIFVVGFGTFVVRKVRLPPFRRGVLVTLECAGKLTPGYQSYRLVQSVSVVPTPIGAGKKVLRLHVESFRMLPGVRPAPVVAACEDVTVTGRFYRHPKPETEEERLYREFLEAEQRQWERDHIFTLPFRQAWDKVKRAYWFVRGLFDDTGFIVLRVNGRRGKWKMYEKPAWVLDEGRPFDAITKQAFA